WLTEVSTGCVERLQLNRAKPVWQMHGKNCNKKNNDHRNCRQGDESSYQNHQAADEFNNYGRPAHNEGNWNSHSVQHVNEVLRSACELCKAVLHEAKPNDEA